MKIKQIKFLFLLFIFSIVIPSVMSIFAQDTNPGRPPIPTQTPIRTPRPTPSPVKSPPKPPVVPPPKTPNPPKTLPAKFRLTISEPESEVSVFNSKGSAFENVDSFLTDSNASPVFFDDFPPGNYTLTVRKEGFFEEKKTIKVERGKPNNFPIKLRPASAFLSVAPNVADAVIEIENIGRYDGRLSNLPLAPGNYRVRVSKECYETETREISLNRVGERQNLNILLNQFSAEKYLPAAQAAFAARNYEKSVEIAEKILAVEPNNAQANLLIGGSRFYFPNPLDAYIYLARAVGGGAKVSLPVKILNKNKNNLQLLSGNLIVEQNAIELRADQPGFGFNATRGNISDIYEKIDDSRVPYVGLKVRGVFNQKMETRTILLYAEDAILQSSGKRTQCPSCADDACYCQSKNTVVSRLLEKWSMKDFSPAPTNSSACSAPF